VNIFLGLIGIVIAYMLIRYRRQIIHFTGPWGWVEKYLGYGRSETACILFGVLLFFLSISFSMGILDSMLLGVLGGLVQK
jgi:uncharacterized membrane protein YeaQ/YmgE (transglycosylase-associated protein family)